MVTDEQVRNLMKLIKKEKTLLIAAAKAGMDEKTARKYRKLQKLPSQCVSDHTWRTRKDPFKDDWLWVEQQLKLNPGLEAKTLFEALQRDYPGKYSDGQLRTLQRRIKLWRVTKGPGKEVFFPQIYHPGVWSESDFTCMNELGITIAGCRFNHLIYHFVLPYSNWETGTVCFSESYESLSVGLQNAVWQLGGVTKYHRTDQLSAAVNKVGHPQEFTQRYQGLERHYGFKGCKTQAGHPNENGDVEQRHFRLKRAVDQALMLRGSRDFADRQEYDIFLEKMFEQLNAGRQERLKEELKLLRQLPSRRLEDYRKLQLKVGPSSTIHVLHNTYSVHSRLIGQKVDVRIYAEHIELWYAQRKVEQMPRLRGESKYAIDYRHIIDRLIRKPGAFENYRYKDALFPTSQFRIAYDWLMSRHCPKYATKEYLKILYLAATESETQVNDALRALIAHGASITADAVQDILHGDQMVPAVTDVDVGQVNIADYDQLLEREEVMV